MAKVFETPYFRYILPREIQLARDATETLRDTSIPASVRLRNAAALYVQHHVGIPSRFTRGSAWSPTRRAELDFIMMQNSYILSNLMDEITNTSNIDDTEIGILKLQ